MTKEVFRMLTPRSQEIATKVIQRRIALLTEIIRIGNEASATMAGLRLALIGTKESTDALMELIRTSDDQEVQEMLAGLIVLCPSRNDYRAELESIEHIREMIGEAYADAAEIDPRVLEVVPLWQVTAKAIDARYVKELSKLDAMPMIVK